MSCCIVMFYYALHFDSCLLWQISVCLQNSKMLSFNCAILTFVAFTSFCAEQYCILYNGLWSFFFFTGWGEPYGGPQKIESSTWSEHAAPPVTVDNGTSAWGKSVDKGSSWEESGRENSGGSSWGNPAIGQQSQHKSGTSHLQLWQITFFDLVSCFVWLFQWKCRSIIFFLPSI